MARLGYKCAGVLSVLIGFFGCSETWKKHFSLEENLFETDTDKNSDGKTVNGEGTSAADCVKRKTSADIAL